MRKYHWMSRLLVAAFVMFRLAAAEPALAQICGDTILDPGEDCDVLLSPCCVSCSFAIAGTPCRASLGGICDPAETCDGTSGDCPADGFQIGGFPCNDSLYCTDVDTCNGSGSCTGTARDCSDSIGCTVDSCNEVGDTCVNSPTGSCDDGNPCTTDACDMLLDCTNTPQTLMAGCFDSVTVRFSLRDDPFVDYKDNMRWKFRRGDDVPLAALGTPLSTTSYGFCIYDQIATTPTLVAGIEVPPDGLLWHPKNERVRFTDLGGTFGGITKIALRSGLMLATSADVHASGEDLVLPPAYDGSKQFAADPSVVMQLFNSDGYCWTTNFPAAGIKRNEPGVFKAND